MSPPIYLSVLEGETPESTRPIITTRDPQLIKAFGEAVRRRLQEGAAAGSGARRILRVLEDVEGGEEADDVR